MDGRRGVQQDGSEEELERIHRQKEGGWRRGGGWQGGNLRSETGYRRLLEKSGGREVVGGGGRGGGGGRNET